MVNAVQPGSRWKAVSPTGRLTLTLPEEQFGNSAKAHGLERKVSLGPYEYENALRSVKHNLIISSSSFSS